MSDISEMGSEDSTWMWMKEDLYARCMRRRRRVAASISPHSTTSTPRHRRSSRRFSPGCRCRCRGVRPIASGMSVQTDRQQDGRTYRRRPGGHGSGRMSVCTGGEYCCQLMLPLSARLSVRLSFDRCLVSTSFLADCSYTTQLTSLHRISSKANYILDLGLSHFICSGRQNKSKSRHTRAIARRNTL